MSRNGTPMLPRRAPQWSHLRQHRRTSLDHASSATDFPASPSSASTHSTIKDERRSVKQRTCTLGVIEGHSRDEVVLNFDRLGAGMKAQTLMGITMAKTETNRSSSGFGGVNKQGGGGDGPLRGMSSSQADPEAVIDRYVFVTKDAPKHIKARQPEADVFVIKAIADAFGMKKGCQVLLEVIDKENPAIEATHVELVFKDQYLSRSDMWRLAIGDLTNRTIYKGQSILFMDTIKASVSAVYVGGRRVYSGFFTRDTRPIFRSESARYVLFIQMAKEMWDFDSESSGEIIFSKVVNGFLPELFKKWENMMVKHLVSIVLFSRVEYDTGLTTDLASSALHSDFYTGIQPTGSKKPYKDFYRVVVSEMASMEWTEILHRLKKEFNFFQRDISSFHHNSNIDLGLSGEDDGKNSQNRITAVPALSMHGNVLEAIHLAASQFAHDYIDRDLTRTGISVTVITPGTGVFEVDYETLRRATEAMVGNGIGIDLVCMPQMPLHSVPLFKYRNPRYSEDRHQSHHLGTLRSYQSRDSTPGYPTPIVGSYQSLSGSYSPSKGLPSSLTRRMDAMAAMRPSEEWCYALPQWLHVSYWTGRSEEALSYAGIALSVKNEIEEDHKDEFTMRCRMYDLQMRSFLETNEIEIAPLHSDPHYPTSIEEPKIVPKTWNDGVNDIVYVPNRHIPDALYDHVYGFQKFVPDRLARPGEVTLWKKLKEFDHSRAKFSTRKRPHRGSRAEHDLEEDAHKQLAEDAGLFGTSLPERRFAQQQQMRKPSMNLPKTERPRATSILKSTEPQTNANKPATAFKQPKFMRQISLGQRGFGVAAPKAAIAEVKTEHVVVAGASGVGADSMRPSTPRLMTEARPSSPQTIRSQHSGSLTISSGRHHPGATDGPAEFVPSTPSIPISRKPTELVRNNSSTALRNTITAQAHQKRDKRAEDHDIRSSNALRAEDAHKISINKLRAGPVDESNTTLSAVTAVAPWLTLLNPSNPESHRIDDAILYSRWQHVFPSTNEMKVQKWKALCCPASVPLTTEYFPSKSQFDSEYQRHPYNVNQNADDELADETRDRKEFIRELISLRFSQGFQVVIGPAVAKAFGQKQIKIADIFSRDQPLEDGTSVFMCVGNTIHQLSCVNGTEVEVNIFVRKVAESSISEDFSSTYKPAIRTLFESSYQTRSIEILTPRPERNWNTIDSYLAGHHDEMMESLRFWRARFVLIPVPLRPSSTPRAHTVDNAEEVRIEGIKRLASLWQKHRYIPPSDQWLNTPGPHKRNDAKLLSIVYKTEDPSVVVAAELETLPSLGGGDGSARKGQLLSRKERFRKSSINLAALAEAMQQPVEQGGVNLRNRRWHLRMHSNSFIGSDMTTWLLLNFEDLDNREEAEALGNKLMVQDDGKQKEREKEGGEVKEDRPRGLFVHVEKRHQFRDGHYYYQISSEYAKAQPGWFGSKRRDASSVPATPMHESSPRPFIPRNYNVNDYDSPTSNSTTPTITTAPGRNHKRPRVQLTKMIKYDVDHRKKSYRPERIDLHYDRLHNPDNCYHVRIDWMNTTAKLVEDVVENWSREASQYGLRLVEVPIREGIAIAETNPFRRPYSIKLAVAPPDHQPDAYLDPNSSGLQATQRKHFYQSAILRKHDFVLDVEAASNFPADVEVRYSWGRPDYRYTQYIHRSGRLLAQIMDDGNFIVVANRLYNNSAYRDYAMRTQAANAANANDQDRVGSSGNNRIPSSMGVGGGAGAGGSDRRSAFTYSDPTPLSSPMMKPATGAAFAHFSPALRPVESSPKPNAPPPVPEPETIMYEFEAFCNDVVGLEGFYRDTLEKGRSLPGTPAISIASGGGGGGGGSAAGGLGTVPEASIPSLGLPPGVLGGDGGLGAGGGGVGAGGASVRMGSPMSFLRRGSVQLEGLTLAAVSKAKNGNAKE